MKITIDKEVLEHVVAYLIQQPYKDVHRLINGINASIQLSNQDD